MLGLTRTPLRVSLFGGGTDYRPYFERRPGAVVGFAIDRYIYVSALKLNGWQDYNYRLAYSQLETVRSIEDLEHPIVREVLRLWRVGERLDLSTQSDFPAGSGLGSSSAFTVGFVNLISTLFGRALSKAELARMAMHVEHDLLQENVGVQDQLHTAFGGLNRFDFDGGDIRVTPVAASPATLARLNSCLVLVHCGVVRRASDAAANQLDAIRRRQTDAELAALYDLVGACVDLLERPGDPIRELGRLLREGWALKRRLASGVTTSTVDELYERALQAGAYGGKLCGAGGGGAVFLLVEPERLAAVREAVSPFPVVPVEIDVAGAVVMHPTRRMPASLPHELGASFRPANLTAAAAE
ncbi:kinase [Phenylobacterium sp.]|uniref:GHMP family kinase ATP-binding protein n=1 Tax=Phenylobacterium sp. TaxID=1871053 RepID=UPI0035B3D1BF